MFLVPVTRQSPEFVRSLDRLFDDTFDRFFGPAAAGAGENNGTRSPALDVAETDRGYTVTLDLPGVSKEDVRVSIDGRRVTVQAQAKREEERKDGDRVVYRERAQSSYARSFTLPLEVDQSEAHAKLENGVLTLALPKRSLRTASQIAVS
jgi:HSP20 family protein